jgi:hypothetical protein
VWVLLFLLTALACAQPAGASKPVFPDDSQDPKQAGGAELLEAVCPGHVVVGKDIECNICPGRDGADNWNLQRVLRGHFLSPQSDDAVLSMAWCEAHEENFGGTILLSKQSGKWNMHWYKAGVPSDNCHRAKLQSGREILICLGAYGGQGMVGTAVYLEDLLAPHKALLADDGASFFAVGDNSGACAYNDEDESKPFSLTRQFIERVDFHKATDGTLLGLSVFTRRGQRTITAAQVKACLSGVHVIPPHQTLSRRFQIRGSRMIRVNNNPGGPK